MRPASFRRRTDKVRRFFGDEEVVDRPIEDLGPLDLRLDPPYYLSRNRSVLFAPSSGFFRLNRD